MLELVEHVPGSDASLTRLPSILPDILSHLQPVALIGYGAYAQVIEVHDTTNGKRHALKILEKEQLEARRMLPQLAMEFGVQSSIHQPHIVRALRLAEDETHAYMLLQLCIGGSVWQATHSFPGHAVPEDISARWLRGAAEGIAYLHDFGLIHRDVKLENLLLDRDGHVRLGDFGWCAFEVDCPSGICGTPQLASPEVASSDLQTSKMDVWALGACLVQLLKGQPLNGPQDAWLHREASAEAHQLADCMLNHDPAERADIQTALRCTFLREAEVRNTAAMTSRSPMWPGETSAIIAGLCPGSELAERVKGASLRLCAAARHEDTSEGRSFCWRARNAASLSPSTKRRKAQLGDPSLLEPAEKTDSADVVSKDHVRRLSTPARSNSTSHLATIQQQQLQQTQQMHKQLHGWAVAYADEARSAAAEASQAAKDAMDKVQECCYAEELCAAQKLQEWTQLLSSQGRLSRSLAARLVVA